MENGRLIDIPYTDSPPVLFTYRQTAAVAAGVYNFSLTTTKGVFTPARPIMGNTLYILRTISFGTDIAQEDYHGAIVTLPEFSAYVQGDAAAPALREPLPLSLYFQNLPFVKSLLGQEQKQAGYPGATGAPTIPNVTPFNQLLGKITGSLTQTPSLLGKASVTAYVILSAQEIIDGAFIEAFRSKQAASHPNAPSGIREGTSQHPIGRVFF